MQAALSQSLDLTLLSLRIVAWHCWENIPPGIVQLRKEASIFSEFLGSSFAVVIRRDVERRSRELSRRGRLGREGGRRC